MASQTILDARNRAYVRAKRKLEANGQYVVNDEAKARKDGKKNLRVAQSWLASAVPLSAANTSYSYNLMDNMANSGNAGLILPQEQRMTLQDVFFTSSLGFYLGLFNWAGAALQNQFQYYAYPPPSISGPLPSIPNVSALTGIWGGELEVKTNGEVVTPSWRLNQHICINQTQSSPGVLRFDQINYGDDGLIVTEPNWIINGGNNNLYTVTYGRNWGDVLGSTSGNAGTSIGLFGIMVWDGWLAQNASSIMDNASMKMN